LLGLTVGAGLLALAVTAGASRSAEAAASGESGATLAGAGTSMVGAGLSSLVGRRRMAISVVTVPMTTAEMPPITSSEGPFCAGPLERTGGGGGP
jgi:hypothetical protein